MYSCVPVSVGAGSSSAFPFGVVLTDTVPGELGAPGLNVTVGCTSGSGAGDGAGVPNTSNARTLCEIVPAPSCSTISIVALSPAVNPPSGAGAPQVQLVAPAAIP